MSDLGRGLIVIGAVVVSAGIILLLLGRFGIHQLPGDLHYEGSRVRVYFPIATCLLLSALLTFGSMLWRWWANR